MEGQNRLTRREMLKLSGGLAAGSLLAAGLPGAVAQKAEAQAQTPVSLSVYDPTGAIKVTQLYSKRLDTLAGKTICEISDGMWQADRTFPLIRELLQKQFPTVKIVPFDKFTTGTQQIQYAGIADEVKKAGCDAAIVGNAG